MIFKIALKSIFSRKLTTYLTILSISISTCLLLGINKLRVSTKQSFQSTISGTDLIIGSRSGSIELLLYSVFRIGRPVSNMEYSSFQQLKSHPEVEWAIPISLGDSHKGFKVIGTENSYFKNYKYAKSQNIKIIAGSNFKTDLDVVIGAKVAKELSYKLGQKITISHGMEEISFQEHDNVKFTVSGILAPTGTPVDASVHISLKALDLVHADFNENVKTEPQITAMFVKLKSKMGIFNFQREIVNFKAEALTAILPGVALSDMWKNLGFFEQALLSISIVVFIASLIGLCTNLLSSLNERRREISIYRAIGASSFFIFGLLCLESMILTVVGIINGLILSFAISVIIQRPVFYKLGISLDIWNLQFMDFLYIIAMLIMSFLIALLPAFAAYKNSLHDGLSIKN